MGKVSVYLSRAQTGVSEELLHHPKIGASVEHVSGEGVTQDVGSNLFSDPCDPRPSLDNALNITGIQWIPQSRQKQPVLSSRFGQNGASLQILLKGLNSILTHGRQTFFLPLSSDSDHRRMNIHIQKSQVHEFLGAYSAGVKEFENGLVPGSQRGIGCGRFNNPGRLFGFQAFRQGTTEPGSRHGLGGVTLNNSLPVQESEIGPEGCEPPGCGSIPAITGLKIREKSPDVEARDRSLVNLTEFPIEVFRKRHQIGAVVPKRMLGVVSFVADVGEKLLEMLRRIRGRFRLRPRPIRRRLAARRRA